MSLAEFTTSVDTAPSFGAQREEFRRAGRSGYLRISKRAFDIVLAVVLLPVLLPAIAFLWAATRRDGGPGFFWACSRRP